MTSTRSVVTYPESTREPTATADELVAWWNRPLPADADEPHARSFRPYKVKVVERQVVNGVLGLTFVLARQSPQLQYSVELPSETSYVWPDLPSTAQLAQAGQFGFLFLSDLWAEDNGLLPVSLAENVQDTGNKWPFGGDGPPSTVERERVLDAMKDEELRDKLLATIDAHVGARKY